MIEARQGLRGVDEEGRLEGEGRAWWVGPCTGTERQVAPAAEPSPVASALWLCGAEAAEARHPPEPWLWES